MEDAPGDAKFTRAGLAKEFGVKSIRVIPCQGGVLEYGIPKDEQLAGNTLNSMLKMKCDIAGMDFAICWMEDDGKYVVAGDYATGACKTMYKAKRGNDDRFETKCKNVKLNASNLKVGFASDAGACDAMGRTALCKDFGIETICQTPVPGFRYPIWHGEAIECWPQCTSITREGTEDGFRRVRCRLYFVLAP